MAGINPTNDLFSTAPFPMTQPPPPQFPSVLNPMHSLIAQAWNMGEKFDKAKDQLITPTFDEWQSLPLLPPPLESLEFLTKAPVWMHLVTWIPAVLFVWIKVIEKRTLGTYCIAWFGFIVVWPLVEYMLHRFVFHSPVAWAKGNGAVNVIRLLMHTVHHAHPRDRMRIVTPLPMSILIGAVIAPPVFWLLKNNSDEAWALICGITLGYVFYDMVHYYLHFGTPEALPLYTEPFRSWLRALHKAHANHHYARDGMKESFGVSHMLWDEIFRTKTTPSSFLSSKKE